MGYDLLKKGIEPAITRRVCCNACGRTRVNILQCSRCQNASCCDSECQLSDWKNHRPRCDETRRLLDLREVKMLSHLGDMQCNVELRNWISKCVLYEIQDALKYGYKLGHPDQLNLTHSAFLNVQYDPTPSDLRFRFTLSSGAVAPISQVVARVHSLLGRSAAAELEQKLSPAGLASHPLTARLNVHPISVVVIAKARKDVLSKGKTASPTIAVYGTRSYISLAPEGMSEDAVPPLPRDENWLEGLKESLRGSQPVGGMEEVDLRNQQRACGGVSAWREYNRDWEAREAAINDEFCMAKVLDDVKKQLGAASLTGNEHLVVEGLDGLEIREGAHANKSNKRKPKKKKDNAA